MPTYRKDLPPSIQKMFNRIAPKYDITNAILSFNFHKIWNQALVKKMLKKDSCTTFVDLCSGTGDIALNFLKKQQAPCNAYLIDFSAEMLSVAKKKYEETPLPHHTVHFIEADVHTIPLPSNSVDCVTMAYGIRNLKDPQQCLHEIYRVLKKNSSVGVLELTRPKSPLLRWSHQFYLQRCLPIIGKFMTKDEEAYSYLCQSIDHFMPTESLEKLFKQAGFSQISSTPLLGGIATMTTATKQ